MSMKDHFGHVLDGDFKMDTIYNGEVVTKGTNVKWTTILVVNKIKGRN